MCFGNFPAVFLTALVLSCLVQSVSAEMSIMAGNGRSAFYRGEEVNLRIEFANTSGADVSDGTIIAKLDGIEMVRSDVSPMPRNGKSQITLRLDTTLIRPGDYELRVDWIASDKTILSALHTLSIARRPNPDRMTVWLWPHQAFMDTVQKFDDSSKKKVDWWASLGLNNFSFTLGAKQGEDARKFWDYAMAKGWTVCLQPEGGLTDVKVESDDPDVYFRDSSGKYRNSVGTGSDVVVANPFHPLVQRWQDEKNRAHMEAVVHYPQVTTAFFNTEVIDSIDRNSNKVGEALIQQELGFTESEIGEPQFVQPGVVADDDRCYRYHQFVFREGSGLTAANERTTAMIRRYRPDILTMSDPYRTHALLGGFSGIDVLGSWTYVNPDPKYMLYVEMLRAAARDGNKIPLSTVTLLNYPGELSPTDQWMLMDAGRLTVVTWINLSRAPRMLGYYFASQLDPFGAGRAGLSRKVNDFEIPESTFDKLRELSERVIQPYGPLIKRMNVSPRRIAVLSSQAARTYGTSPSYRQYYPNTQAFEFYILLAMAQLPADIVLDETIQRFGLDSYDVLVLPKCDVLTQSVYEAILAFQKRGGLVVADQYLGPSIPNALRFNFDFLYRSKVSAMAIAKNQAYTTWDDHLKPGSAEIEEVQGVTAMDDQRIMESYAARLREGLADRVQRQVDCDFPTALLNLTEADGVKYLFVVNDKREYGSRLGEYKSVLEKIVPQTVRIRLIDPVLKNTFVYDLLKRRQLEINDGTISVDLDELGGTIIAMLPERPDRVELRVAKSMVVGNSYVVSANVLSKDGEPIRGAFPLKITLTDPKEQSGDISDFYCADQGALLVPYVPALNDCTGNWKVRVEDLTAGLSAESSFALSR